jgi:hypothetical protein
LRPKALGVLLAVAVGACGGTEPIELAASYTLSRVEGVAPPQLVGANVECDVSVVGGRITFESSDQSVPVPDDYFELGLDVLTDCSRGGGSTSESTYGYTGTVESERRRVAFHTSRGSLGPLVFEGTVSSAGRLEVVVPFLVPTVDQVSVDFVPD